jgi:hypothetical protein
MAVIRKNNICIILVLLFFCKLGLAENWSFKLKSKVELRSWRLGPGAVKSYTLLSGASVKLYKGAELVSESLTDVNGNFEMNIPSNGNYTLKIEYTGWDTKIFKVSAKGVPPNKDDHNFKPSLNMVGMVSSKHTQDKRYLGLDQPHVKIEYNSAKHDPNSKRNYNHSQNIRDAEHVLIQKFCTANKLGDMAYAKKNYELAKTFYLMATDMMAGESYPHSQLKATEAALKTEKAKEKSTKTTAVKAKKAQQIYEAEQVKSSDFKKTSKGSGKKIPRKL